MELNESADVAIITPCYNVEKYLEQMICSVLGQSYKKFVFILIDDGSTDDTVSIIDRFAEQDRRIVFFSQVNQGVSTARNRGVEIANRFGSVRFVSFIDSDDVLDENYIKKHVEALTDSNSDYSFCRIANLTKRGVFLHGNAISDRKIPSRITGKDIILSYFGVGIWSDVGRIVFLNNKMFRKEIIDGIYFNEEMNYGEDVDFMFTVLKRVKFVSFVDEPLFVYRRRKTSISQSNKREWAFDIQRMIKFSQEQYPRKCDTDELSKTVTKLVFFYSCAAFVYGGKFLNKDNLNASKEGWNFIKQYRKNDLNIFYRITLRFLLFLVENAECLAGLIARIVFLFVSLRKRNWF